MAIHRPSALRRMAEDGPVPFVLNLLGRAADEAELVADFGQRCGVRSPVTCDSWPAWVLQTAHSYLNNLVEAGHATDTFRTQAIKVFKRSTPTIDRGSLVHGDLTGCETFVDPERGVVTGIVDWGGAIVGDPVFELAKVSAGGPADDPGPKMMLPTLLDRYVAETGIDRARINRTLPLYQAHNAIFNADWCRREGVPWIDGLLAAADAWLRTV